MNLVGHSGRGLPRVRSRIVPVVTLAAALTVLAGCGSSSSSSSSTSTSSSASASSSSSTAAMAHPKPIRGVRSPAGAVVLSKASLHRFHKVTKGAGVSAHIAGLDGASVTQQVQTLSGDINQFWSSLFAHAGVQWPAMQDVVVDSQPVQTQCSGRATIGPTDPWFLCDGQNGGTFYWTIPWIQQNIATDQGGVNLAFSMAEMWGYHILNLAGATAQLSSGHLSKGQWAQQVMCLTGIYARSINQRQLFERGDQQAVQSFLGALSSVAGIGAPDVSPQQLTQAFAAGFNSGDIGTCGLSTGGGNGGGGGTSSQTQTNGGGTTPAPISPLPATTTG